MILIDWKIFVPLFIAYILCYWQYFSFDLKLFVTLWHRKNLTKSPKRILMKLTPYPNQPNATSKERLPPGMLDKWLMIVAQMVLICEISDLVHLEFGQIVNTPSRYQLFEFIFVPNSRRGIPYGTLLKWIIDVIQRAYPGWVWGQSELYDLQQWLRKLTHVEKYESITIRIK